MRHLALVLLASSLASLFAQQPPAAPVKKAAPPKVTQTPVTPRPESSAPAPPGFTVDSVISLIEAGLSEDIVIARLRKENKPFDLSAGDMIRLKKAGAGDGVLTVMMDPKAEVKPPAQQTLPPSAPEPKQASTSPPVGESVPVPAVTSPGASQPSDTQAQKNDPAEQKKKVLGVPVPKIGLPGRGSNWKDQLEEELKGTWAFSKIGIDRIRITQPGAILVIKKDGIIGDLSTDSTFSKTTAQDGKLTPPKGVIAVLQNKETSHVFKVGERVYLWKASIDDDDLALFLISVETFAVNARGTTKQMRYKALVDFKFAKDYLRTADFTNVKTTLSEIFATEQEYQGANTKSVSLGQTPQEIEGILGKPEKIINLGAKVTWVYKDIKVVFTDGKVADVQ
jgi:hypothetical protein